MTSFTSSAIIFNNLKDKHTGLEQFEITIRLFAREDHDFVEVLAKGKLGEVEHQWQLELVIEQISCETGCKAQSAIGKIDFFCKFFEDAKITVAADALEFEREGKKLILPVVGEVSGVEKRMGRIEARLGRLESASGLRDPRTRPGSMILERENLNYPLFNKGGNHAIVPNTEIEKLWFSKGMHRITLIMSHGNSMYLNLHVADGIVGGHLPMSTKPCGDMVKIRYTFVLRCDSYVKVTLRYDSRYYEGYKNKISDDEVVQKQTKYVGVVVEY
jgi:hypothetical protein